jgi:hypothetical protein
MPDVNGVTLNFNGDCGTKVKVMLCREEDIQQLFSAWMAFKVLMASGAKPSDRGPIVEVSHA